MKQGRKSFPLKLEWNIYLHVLTIVTVHHEVGLTLKIGFALHKLWFENFALITYKTRRKTTLIRSRPPVTPSIALL